MIIKSIELAGYRNYDFLTLQFDKGTNILFGDNAQGKTNILEAIYLCATTKSHKGSKDKEIINFDNEEAHIRAYIEKEDVETRIDMHLRKSKSKGIAVDGQKLKKAAQLLGLCNVVFFSPEDLSIIKNGPSERRRFVDMELCQLDGFYLIHDIETLSGNDTYSWTYMSPDIFKIILYLPDGDQFILSDTYEKYAFQNTYRLIVDEENASLQLIEDYDYSSLIVTFLVCCSMTLLIELFIAFLFNYRDKKDFMFIVKTNCFTQIILHVYLQFMVYQYDFFSVLFYYLFAETAVLVIESFLYWKNLKKKSHPLLYAFIANTCSFLLGSYLLKTILYLIHY